MPPAAPTALTPQPVVLCTEPDEGARRRVWALERLAGELADQRLQLAELWERLVRTHQRWQQDRDAAAAELERLAARLPEQEQALVARNQRLQEDEAALGRRQADLVQLRHQLEGLQARLRARELAVAAECERHQAALRGREEVVERLRKSLGDLQRKWNRRRRQEVERLREEHAGCCQLRKEWAALRQEWWRRSAVLEEQRRLLAEKELALERHRQQCLTGTTDAAAAERAIERLRRRWARQNAAAVRATAAGRQKLHAEASQLEAQAAALQTQRAALAQREADVAEQQAALEHRQTQAEDREGRGHQEMQRLQALCESYERQIAALRDELERMARLLLEDGGDPVTTLGQAA
jgi:chromosome segregation ATPase